ncbi:MAG: GNAT family N-acetyltransferase [Planctomycetota bacterium]|nr:MAG: GNAT family N-acetyltransferase [Planctomycetota bacterium]
MPAQRAIEASPGDTASDAASPERWMELRSLEAIEDRRADLQRLWERSPLRTPNAQIDRYLATTAALAPAQQPWVSLLVDDGEQPVVALLGRTLLRKAGATLGYLRFSAVRVRALDVVYGGALGELTPQRCAACCQRLGAVLRSGAVHSVQFNHLETESPLAAAIESHPATRSLARLRAHEDVHLFCQLLPRSDKGFVDRLSSKHRYNLRRAERLLAEEAGGPTTFKRVETTAAVDDFVKRAAQVAARSWQARIGAAFADTPLWRSGLTCEATHGRLRAYLLEAGGRPVAYQIGAVHDGVYFLEVVGYDPDFARHSPGRLLLVKTLDDLEREGVGVFDFGFGDASYKRIYATGARQEALVSLFGPGLRPRMAWLSSAAGERLRRGAREAAAKRGALGLVKRLWRTSLLRKRSKR